MLRGNSRLAFVATACGSALIIAILGVETAADPCAGWGAHQCGDCQFGCVFLWAQNQGENKYKGECRLVKQGGCFTVTSNDGGILCLEDCTCTSSDPQEGECKAIDGAMQRHRVADIETPCTQSADPPDPPEKFYPALASFDQKTMKLQYTLDRKVCKKPGGGGSGS